MEEIAQQQMTALTVFNGFSNSKCRDQYMSSLLISAARVLHDQVPTTNDLAIFDRPPWENQDFFNQLFLPGETQRCWIFRHGDIPKTYNKMLSNFVWKIKSYGSIQINDYDLLVRNLELAYNKNNHQHPGGEVCVCPHGSNMEKCRGWKLMIYRHAQWNKICCLSYKKKGPEACLVRKGSDKQTFEGEVETDASVTEKMSGVKTIPPKSRFSEKHQNTNLPPSVKTAQNMLCLDMAATETSETMLLSPETFPRQARIKCTRSAGTMKPDMTENLSKKLKM